MKKVFNNKMCILIILVMTIVLLLQLFINKRIEGHDTLFHVSNIIYLSKTISFTNIFGSDILFYNFNNFGYGIYLFYPKLSHLLCSYAYLITNNIYLSMNIIYLITTFLSGLMCYLLFDKKFNNKILALLSSAIYLSFSYHLCEIYVRDAFAENFMFFVIPMIFLGINYLKENNYKMFYLFFVLGYLIGIHSHLISMVFCTIFLAIYILYYRKVFLVKDKIKALIISTLIVTGISLPFLISILEHKILGEYVVFTDWFSSRQATIGNVSIIRQFFTTEDYFNKGITLYLGIITISLLIITTINFIFSKDKQYHEEKKFYLFSIIILVTLICSKLVWNNIPDILTTIQFPWRLMIFLVLVISLYCPLIFLKLKFKYKNILIILCIVLLILIGYNNVNYSTRTMEELKSSDAVNNLRTMGHQLEYLPHSDYFDDMISIFSTKHYFETREEGIVSKDNVDYDIILDSNNSFVFKINDIDGIIELELPRIYYLGYVLEDSEGNNIKLFENKNGFIGVKIDKEGTYYLEYVGTIYKRIAKLIQIITIILVVGSVVVKWIRRKKLQ